MQELNQRKRRTAKAKRFLVTFATTTFALIFAVAGVAQHGDIVNAERYEWTKIADTAIQYNPNDVAITPDGKTGVVSSSDGINHLITVFKVDNPTSRYTVTLSSQAQGIAIMPDGKSAIVGRQGSASVSVVDLTKKATPTSISLSSGIASDVAITPDGIKIIATNQTNPSILLFNPDGSGKKSVNIGYRSGTAVITPDNAKAVITNPFDSKVTILNLANTANFTTASLPGNPSDIVMSPDGSHAYAVVGGNIVVIDMANPLAAKTTVPLASPAGFIAMMPSGKQIVIDNGNGTISLLNVSDSSFGESISASGNQGHKAVSPDGKTILVVGRMSKVVSILRNTHYVTVSFDSNGGTETYPTQELIDGVDKLTNPGVPARGGYTFKGWFNTNAAWNFNGFAPATDMTLVAQWEEIAEQGGGDDGGNADNGTNTPDNKPSIDNPSKTTPASPSPAATASIQQSNNAQLLPPNTGHKSAWIK